MSGGSYDYFYSQLEDLRIRHTETDPRRAGLQKIIDLLAKAMHDVEWVDSSDYCKGDEHKAIDALFAALGSDPVMVKKALAFDAMKDQLQEFFKE